MEKTRRARTPEQIQQDDLRILTLLQTTDLSQKEISRQLDVPYSAVNRLAKQRRDEAAGVPPAEPTRGQRTDEERANDRVEIMRLYVKGWKQRAIAQHLNLSEPTISREIAAIEDEWAKKPIQQMELHRNRIAAGLREVYSEAWGEYERSKETRVKKKQRIRYVSNEDTGKEEKVVEPLETSTETRNGDPRYLKVMSDTLELEAKLLGVNAPEKHEHTGKDGGAIDLRNIHEVSDKALEAIVVAGTNGSRENTD